MKINKKKSQLRSQCAFHFFSTVFSSFVVFAKAKFVFNAVAAAVYFIVVVSIALINLHNIRKALQSDRVCESESENDNNKNNSHLYMYMALSMCSCVCTFTCRYFSVCVCSWPVGQQGAAGDDGKRGVALLATMATTTTTTIVTLLFLMLFFVKNKLISTTYVLYLIILLLLFALTF